MTEVATCGLLGSSGSLEFGFEGVDGMVTSSDFACTDVL